MPLTLLEQLTVMALLLCVPRRFHRDSLQLTWAKCMCVVALTAGIAASNIKLLDDHSAVRHQSDTEKIFVTGSAKSIRSVCVRSNA